MNLALACQKALLRYRPSLAGSPVHVIETGWDCLVIDAGRLIFKFPRDDTALARLRTEALSLRFAAAYSCVPIPDLNLVEDPQLAREGGPALFSVHETIVGSSLEPADYAAMGLAERERIAGEIAATMVAFHRADPAAAREYGVPSAPVWPSVSALRTAADTYCDGQIAALAHAVLCQWQASGEDHIVFGHFDTHGWNMALSEDGTLAGLFDFGHAGVGPLHRDLSYPAFVGADFACRVAAQYATASGRAVDVQKILNTHAVLRLVELYEAAPCDKSVRATAFARTMADISEARNAPIGAESRPL